MATTDDLYKVLLDISGKLDMMVRVSQNAPGIQVENIPVTSITDPLSIPVMPVPDGMELVVQYRALSPGSITVSSKDDRNKTTLILPNQARNFRVKNSRDLLIMGTGIGGIIELFCEKK